MQTQTVITCHCRAQHVWWHDCTRSVTATVVTPEITDENADEVLLMLEKRQLKRDAAKIRAEGGDEDLARHLDELSDRL